MTLGLGKVNEYVVNFHKCVRISHRALALFKSIIRTDACVGGIAIFQPKRVDFIPFPIQSQQMNKYAK